MKTAANVWIAITARVKVGMKFCAKSTGKKFGWSAGETKEKATMSAKCLYCGTRAPKCPTCDKCADCHGPICGDQAKTEK